MMLAIAAMVGFWLLTPSLARGDIPTLWTVGISWTTVHNSENIFSDPLVQPRNLCRGGHSAVVIIVTFCQSVTGREHLGSVKEGERWHLHTFFKWCYSVVSVVVWGDTGKPGIKIIFRLSGRYLFWHWRHSL